jgi:hypothetical protein
MPYDEYAVNRGSSRERSGSDKHCSQPGIRWLFRGPGSQPIGMERWDFVLQWHLMKRLSMGRMMALSTGY